MGGVESPLSRGLQVMRAKPREAWRPSTSPYILEPTCSRADTPAPRPSMHARPQEIMKNLLIQKFSRVSQKDIPRDMPYLWEKVEELKKLLVEKAPKHVVPTPVRGEMPPCIIQILAKIRGGEDVSHIENFTVASYMANTGYSVDEIIDVFKDRSDFDEKVARYQVEHIAGLRGSRVKYKPPSCSKMKSYGLCIEDGARCLRKIRNPLKYRAEEVGENDGR